MVWEAIFMLLILKIPVVYLCVVVYWAVKAEPRPPEGAARLAEIDPDPPSSWWRRASRRRYRPRGGPHGSPARTYARTARAALTTAAGRKR